MLARIYGYARGLVPDALLSGVLLHPSQTATVRCNRLALWSPLSGAYYHPPTIQLFMKSLQNLLVGQRQVNLPSDHDSEVQGRRISYARGHRDLVESWGLIED